MPALKFLHHTFLFWLLFCFLAFQAARIFSSPQKEPPPAFRLVRENAAPAGERP
ncbi:MAG TPA: hypothetical protein VL688_08345 [Verrucomicrobiae bacterium]|jgi:hypothetical protein|nr:hypothetical protein [Verrucomicrobiae bacterium]